MNTFHVGNFRKGSSQMILDAALGVSLVLALLVVSGIDRWRTKPAAFDDSQPISATETTAGNTTSSLPPARPMCIGVTPDRPEFDDMGSLLTTLGEGYKFRGFPMEDLTDMAKISELNIIFLTCSGIPESWVKQRLGQAARDNMITVVPDEKILKRASDNLRAFVGSGGTLYVSDLHYDLVAQAFPELRDFRNFSPGKKQTVAAKVVDPGLRELIGGELSLDFDQTGWKPAAFAGKNVVSYLTGSYQTLQGEEKSSPFLVKFRHKDGTVIFTSFHNERQNSEVEKKLLQFLVFAAVTAREDKQISDTIDQGGFKPEQKNIFAASKKQPVITKLHHVVKEGQLKFVLMFPNVGAKLKLTVAGPNGESFAKEGTSTLTLDVPRAAVGDWKYTVTAVDLPTESFTYKVIVGQK